MAGKKKKLKRLHDELRQHSSDSSEISNGSDTSSKSQTVETYTSLERNDNSYDLDSSFEDVSKTPSLFAIREDKNEASQFKIMISSPIAANARNEFRDPNLSEIDLASNCIDADDSISSVSDESQNGDTVASNFELCAQAIISRHGTSDAEANNWFKLIRSAFPEKVIPSFKSFKRRNHVVEADQWQFIRSSALGKRWQLDFISELRDIINSNIHEIYKFSAERDTHKDLRAGNCFNHTSQILSIHLLINSDGVNAFKSNAKSLWPVWIAIADLPPVKRCMFKNIALATLWFGSNKPGWDKLFQVKEFSRKNFFF